jgi:hypothetical protein
VHRSRNVPNGRRCHWTAFSFGCTDKPDPESRTLDLCLQTAGDMLLLWGEAPATIAKFRLVFAGGATTTITPREGYVLAAIPADHYPRDRRLIRAIGYDNMGHERGRHRFDPDEPIFITLR